MGLMQEVFCHECGASLGYQVADTVVNRRNWRHNRCPVRIAAALGLSDEDYRRIFQGTAMLITAAYPDFAQQVEGSHPGVPEGWALMRAEIAAGMVLEGLSQSYTLTAKKRPKKRQDAR